MHKFAQLLIAFLLFIVMACNSHSQTSSKKVNKNSGVVGGGCDGCELMYVGMPKNISSADTSVGWKETGQRLLLTGTVFKRDGKTPAPNVIIYYWQTNNNGRYSPVEGQDKAARRHGHIRGWVKTDDSGHYSVYTIRPAPYPNQTMPAHIHTSIKEPDIANEYYIDEFVFDDDKLLTKEKRKQLDNRGGSGILRILLKGDLQVAEHNIILGLNIPNYPVQQHTPIHSGLTIGEDQPSFTPYHAFGPDKGTQTCPVCKYGRYQGILYFVGNRPNWKDITEWLRFLDSESLQRQHYLKAYFVYGNEKSYSKKLREAELDKLGRELELKNIALTFVPSFSDKETEAALNKINQNTENTFIIFKNRNIVDKYIDLKPTIENFTLIKTVLEKTKGNFFDLPEPVYN